MKFPTGGPIPFLSDDSRNNSLTKFSNVRNKYFVSVGYQNGRKRFDLLLKSWKNVNSGYDLCVVGDGPNHDSLIELSKKEGVFNRVHFFRNISDIDLSTLLGKAVGGVVMSSREGFPATIVECLRSGIPVLFFYAGDIKSYDIIKSEFLRIYPISSIDSMSDNINTLISDMFSSRRDKIIEWAETMFQTQQNYGIALLEALEKVNLRTIS